MPVYETGRIALLSSCLESTRRRLIYTSIIVTCIKYDISMSCCVTRVFIVGIIGSAYCDVIVGQTTHSVYLCLSIFTARAERRVHRIIFERLLIVNVKCKICEMFDFTYEFCLLLNIDCSRNKNKKRKDRKTKRKYSR